MLTRMRSLRVTYKCQGTVPSLSLEPDIQAPLTVTIDAHTDQ